MAIALNRWVVAARLLALPLLSALVLACGGCAAGAACNTPAKADGRQVYLIDMTPIQVTTYHDWFWGFGRGSMNGEGAPIRVKGVISPNGLGTHAPNYGEGFVAYDIGGAFRRFTGGVGIDDDSPHAPTVTFRIVADGREIWRSGFISTPSQAENFDVDVTGVQVLQLCVNCPSGNAGAHTVWTEPVLTRAKNIVWPARAVPVVEVTPLTTPTLPPAPPARSTPRKTSRPTPEPADLRGVTVQATLPHGDFTAGLAIPITLTITNASSETVAWMEPYANRDGTLRFKLNPAVDYTPAGRSLFVPPMMGFAAPRSHPRTLEPGKSETWIVDVAKYFDFRHAVTDKPTPYTLATSLWLRRGQSGSYSWGTVDAAPITFTVRPAPAAAAPPATISGAILRATVPNYRLHENEPIPVKLVLTNGSDQAVSWLEANAQRDGVFALDLTPELPWTPAGRAVFMPFEALHVLSRELKPGASETWTVDLSKYFDFRRASVDQGTLYTLGASISLYRLREVGSKSPASACSVTAPPLQFWIGTPEAPSPRRVTTRPPAPTPPPGTPPPGGQTYQVFLCDLTPVSIDTYHDQAWGFGNKGSVGLPGVRIRVNGVESPHGLGTHAATNHGACVIYDLGQGYRRFMGSVAVDGHTTGAVTPLTFRIVVDGREVWKSQPATTEADEQAFGVDVTGVKTLELHVDCPGNNLGAHAVWIEPTLTRVKPQKAPTVDPALSTWIISKPSLSAQPQKTPTVNPAPVSDAPAPPGPGPSPRWTALAAQPGLSAMRKAAYEQIALLPECDLQQMSVPGSYEFTMPAPGTPDAAGKLYRMGLDVVPILAEALDDTTWTRTFTVDGHGGRNQYRVNDIVGRLIRRLCDRDFYISPAQRNLPVEKGGAGPGPAAQLRKAVIDWYNENRDKTEAQRKTADVANDYLGNRLRAIEWLGHHKDAGGGEAIRQRVETILSSNDSNSLVDSELATCSLALGQIGDRANLPAVQKICARFSESTYRHFRPINEGQAASGSSFIHDLCETYHGLALLGEKAAALEELHRLYDTYGTGMEGMQRNELKQRMVEAERW